MCLGYSRLVGSARARGTEWQGRVEQGQGSERREGEERTTKEGSG